VIDFNCLTYKKIIISFNYEYQLPITTLSKNGGVIALLAGTLAISSPAQAITIDFANVGTSQPASFTNQGATVTGSANLNLSQGNGLGIVGGITLRWVVANLSILPLRLQ
jgi:hypothetical protein